MGFKFKRLVKSTKKAIKSVTRTTAKVVAVAAPIVGTAVFGAAGGAIGTAIGAAAAQVGPNKNRSSQLKRSLVSGAAITGAGAALGLASGAGLAASGISSISRIFGGGPVAQPGGNDPLGNALLTGNGSAGSSNELFRNALLSDPAAGTAMGVAGQPPARALGLENALLSGMGSFIGNQNGPSGLEGSGARAGGTFGTEGGGVASGGILGGLPQPEPGETKLAGMGLIPLLAIGAGAFLLLSRKR